MKYYTLFIGYDIPLALDIKHGKILPLLDDLYERHDLEGDIVHLVPESDIDQLNVMLELINHRLDIGLNADFAEAIFAIQHYVVKFSINGIDMNVYLYYEDHARFTEDKMFEEAVSRLKDEGVTLSGSEDYEIEILERVLCGE